MSLVCAIGADNHGPSSGQRWGSTPFYLRPFSSKGDTMARLNQIIAIEKGTKSQSLRELSDAHHTLQKQVLLAGITRTYQPKDEEGEQYPPRNRPKSKSKRKK